MPQFNKAFINTQSMIRNAKFRNILRKNRYLLASFIFITGTNVLAGEISRISEMSNLDCWKGFYVGAELGGGWSDEHWHYTNPNYFNTLGAQLLGNNFNLNAHNVAGAIDGGFNFQSGRFVFGIEGSVIGIDLDDQRASPFFPIEDDYSSSVSYFVTAKGRVGYSYQRWLPYISAGWTGGDASLTLTDTVNGVRATSKKWTNGWIAGVGVDYRLTQLLSLGIAYDYSQLTINNRSASCPTCGTGLGLGAPNVNSHINTQTIMVRLNYLINQ